MKIIMSQWLNRWWWLITLPIIVQLFLGITHNIVYLYTSFITIFLILPPAFLFLYYFYALTTEARISIQNKYLEFKKDGIKIIFDSETEEKPSTNSIFIEKGKITSVKYTEKYILIMLQRNKYSNITLPFSAIANEEQFQEIATLFNCYTQNIDNA